MFYKIETKVIKAGLFTDAQDKIAKQMQEILDAGSSQGWKLHTLVPTESSKGINLCVVWEVNN